MALPQVKASLGTLSGAAWIGIGAGAFVLIVIIASTVSWWNGRTIASLRKQAAELRQENVKLTDSYNQALGVAKANEQAAKEEKAKADAIIATIEARTTNVRLLDDKLAQANANYEKAKSELGDCADSNDCLKRLCVELKAAGFKVPDCN